MPIHTLTFGSQYSHTTHPFFGDFPTLPYGYAYVDAPTEYDARAVTIAAFGTAWSMLHPGDVDAQNAQDPGWDTYFPQGLMFILRPDTVGQPILTFRAPRTGAPMPAAIYLDPAGYARYYEDQGTGPMNPARTRGLTRVDLPEEVTHVQPRDIVAAERERRDLLTRRQNLLHRIDFDRAHMDGTAPKWIGGPDLTPMDYADDIQRATAQLAYIDARLAGATPQEDQ